MSYLPDKIRQGMFGRNREADLKNYEQFHESLVAQYRDLIHEALLESDEEHKTKINIGILNAKLNMIYRSAKCDGLDESIIDELVNEVIPSQPSQAA
ncbi:MAG TPA: hypothetical protein VKY27_07255 [Bacteriovoracaceae bacterium]|nr:hypothetical protein [Bacteriovoracaceae bacterium]